MTYQINLKGYDTLSFHSTKHSITVEAESPGEAKKKAIKWCKDNSAMGGYEWFIEKENRNGNKNQNLRKQH